MRALENFVERYPLCALNWLIFLQSGFVGPCFSEEEETLFVRGLSMQLTA